MKKIFVTWVKEGIHCYPEAANNEKLASVSFLAHPHRHLFNFRVELEVFHDDREVEFIMLKRELEGLYTKQTLQLDFKSCEMIADELCGYILHRYPNRQVKVEVSEDGENGAIISYD